jgi:LacI family transcriptional regulator
MAIPKSSAPTIIDVADLAGVSRATASRAMGGYGRISAETVVKVKAAADQLGYRPNQVARAMRAGRTKTIGLVILADFTSSFFDRATKAIVDSARSRGYQVLIANTDTGIEAERHAVEVLLEKQVDGLIVVPSSTSATEHLTRKHLAGAPLVLVDRTISGFDVSSVTTDDLIGGQSALRHVAAMGHTRVAFLVAAVGVSGFTNERPATLISSVHARVEGFLKGCSASNIRSANQTWIFCENDSAAAENAVRSILGKKKRPTAIITSNNDMAIAVLKFAANQQLQIGRDISLITFDDSPWAAAMAPGISVVARPVELLGEVAVQTLLSELDRPDSAHQAIVLPTELVTRGSVANLVMYPELDPESQR